MIRVKRLLTSENLRPLQPMLIMAVGIGIARFLWGYYLSRLRGPLGLGAVEFVCAPFVVLVIVIVTICLFLVRRSILQTENVIPTWFLIFGIFLAFQIPLPEPPDTPEKLHFLQYHADYEATVEMAKNDELVPSPPDCRAGFSPPELLPHVSSAGFMFISHDEHGGLLVFFHPLESFYHLVAYV
ncbi:MAG: hypothetical protein H7175_22545 [Burkholderiales bacterium]|nr:hypothetical protein [Anaerolineae bacterium]